MARAADACTLRAAERYDAAYYLAGFAVECALKARIARGVGRYQFPDKRLAEKAFTHDLEGLLVLARLRGELNEAKVALREKWATVTDWSVDTRYRLGITAKVCDDFMQAVVGRGGILPWLKQRW